MIDFGTLFEGVCLTCCYTRDLRAHGPPPDFAADFFFCAGCGLGEGCDACDKREAHQHNYRQKKTKESYCVLESLLLNILPVAGRPFVFKLHSLFLN